MNLSFLLARFSRKHKTSRKEFARRRRSALRIEGLEQRAVFAVAGADLLAVCSAPVESAPAYDSSAVVHPVFAPDTPWEVTHLYEAAGPSEPGIDFFSFNDSDRWSRTVTNGSGLTQGDPTTLTWSVVPDGTSIGSNNGEPAAPSNLRSYLAGIYGTNSSSSKVEDQPWFPVMKSVFDRWSALSGVTYVYASADDGAGLGSGSPGAAGVRGDVRISGHYIDGPSNILAYNFFPTVGDMVLDTGDTFFANTAGNSLRLRNTMAHEAGHGLGLGHVQPVNGTKLMEPTISLNYDGPQADDILAINRGYGDILEKNGGNNTAATGNNLTVTAGSFTVDTLSIDDDSDVDYFKLSIPAGQSVNLTLTPTGSTYTTNGATFDSLSQSDLALAIYDTNGSTILASANINGAGAGESITNLILPGSGTYFVRVSGNANAAQMYRLSGTLTSISPQPNAVLYDGSTILADGTGVADFGSTLVGAPVTKTFTVKNSGQQNLVLNPTITVPAGFTLVSGFSQTTLATNQSATFTVRMDASALGNPSGRLFFTSNDPNESPYDIALQGSVTNAFIIDNGDAGYASSGGWNTLNSEGFQGDIQHNKSFNSGAAATWTFGSLTPGTYRVSATWSAYVNRATNSPFTIFDGSTSLGTVSVNQELAPNDFSDAGGNWEDLGTFTITGNTLAVRLTDSANEYVIADGMRVEKVGQVAPAPEVDVFDGANAINANGTIDFGTTVPGSAITKTFTVNNSGNDTLSLGSAITLPNGFSLAQGFGSTSLAAGQSTTFSVRLDATAVQSPQGVLSFTTNDSDENPFQFTIKGSVVAQTTSLIIDNGAAGYSSSGGWNTLTSEGYLGDTQHNLSFNSGSTATWAFANITPGIYRVSATWTAYTNRATNAPYTVFDGTTSLGTVRVNQEVAPNDRTDAGGNWEDLGTFTINGNSLVVKLSDNANEYVMADAIRIEKVGEILPAPEIDVLNGTSNVNVNSTVDFGVTTPGTPVTKTFTVRNSGNDTLTLGSSITLPAGFSLAQGFSSTSLAPGQSTTFAVQLDAAAAQAYQGVLSFTTNDSDESPFQFTIKGSVVTAVTTQIIDNGDAGYSSSGGWKTLSGEGYQNDIQHNLSFNSGSSATWTFANLAPGTYRVSATWSNYFNRATDAPFTIFDGGTSLGTVRINEELAPNDLVDNGTNWEDLGTFTITGSTLSVRLTDNANEYVIADAIRIQRVA